MTYLISDTNKEIVEVPIGILKPFPNNPHVHDEIKEGNLTESVKLNGQLIPLIVNKAKSRENIVIGGSFSLSIYMKLGFEKVLVLYVNIEDEKKERELNIRLNATYGYWDWEILKDNYSVDDLLNWGLDEFDLAKYWDNELAVEDDHFDIDEAIEDIKKNPIAKTGDLFQLGNHLVICGNSNDISIVKKLVGKRKVSYINNDPPYNIKLDYSKGIGNKSNYGGDEKDSKSESEYKSFLKTTIENALSVIQKDSHIFYWTDEKNVWVLQELYNELKIKNKRLCIWIKNNQNVTPQVAFNKMTEYAVYGTIGKPFLNTNVRNLNEIQNKEVGTGNRSADDIYDLLNIWLVDRLPSNEYKHPTMKPPTLYEKAIRRCTKIGDYVLDLFGGSGSQLIACEQLKRKALLVEMDPVFVDLILYRYEQLTGTKPIKLS